MSTTQVLCGALLGVGLFEGTKGVNWKLSLKVGRSCCTSACTHVASALASTYSGSAKLLVMPLLLWPALVVTPCLQCHCKRSVTVHSPR